MESTTTHIKVLALTKLGTQSAALVAQMVPEGEIHEVGSFEEVLTALRGGSFDLVIADREHFKTFEHTIRNEHASIVLETIGQGVCIIASGGSIVWANPRMKAYPEDLMIQVAEACTRTFGATHEAERGTPAFRRARRFSLTAGKDQHFEVTVTPVLNEVEGIDQLVAVVWDVTQARRLQKKIDAIDLAGKELVRLDRESASMSMEERIELLEEKMLGYMHEMLHYDNFAVLLLDQKTNRLEFVLQHGMCEKSRNLDIFASPENNGISGYVAATGRSYICHDTQKDPRYLQGLELARSSLTVPLRLHDQVIGVMDIESDKPAAFNEDDRQFAEILARYVAIALNFLDLLVIERYETSGRMADDVSGEIAGPLNDIITEASTIIEEYIGNDDLRHRLNSILDNVAEIKSRIKEAAAPSGGILGRAGDSIQADPLLSGKRILVADDEEIIRETVGGVLRKFGCQVDIAADGREASEMVLKKEYDLLLADIKMPFKNGYEVYAAAREAHPNIPVILMTGFGYDPNHSIVRARKEGLKAVLFKPFKVDQLLTEIRGVFQPTGA